MEDTVSPCLIACYIEDNPFNFKHDNEHLLEH